MSPTMRPTDGVIRFTPIDEDGRRAWPGYLKRRGGVAVNQFVST